MLTMNYDLERALKEYILLLKKGEYFDAHEALEEAWHPLRLKDHYLKNLVKGLINAAIGFEHIKRDSKDAKRKALRVMQSYDRHKGLSTNCIEYALLFAEACEIVEELRNKKFLTIF